MSRHRSCLWLALAGVVLCGLMFASETRAVDPAGRTPRTAVVTCCERAEEAWTILSAWHRSCTKPSARASLTSEKYAAMLSLQSRSSVSASTVRVVCEGTSLSQGAVAAYVRHALCTSLPRTHTDLARSVYSALMDEAPDLEDELTDDMASSCRDLQVSWMDDPAVWVARLRAQASLTEAQAALCLSQCRLREDAIDGATYDL